MKRILLFIVLAVLLSVTWSTRISTYALHRTAIDVHAPWQAHNYDLVYTAAFSSEQQPDGPLVVYRAPMADLRASVAVAAVSRGPLAVTPLFFPSPDGRYLALQMPVSARSTASLSVLSTDGGTNVILVPRGVAMGDQVIWSADSHALYYHTVTNLLSIASGHLKGATHRTATQEGSNGTRIAGYDEIHRVDLHGHDITILHHVQDDGSLRLVGVNQAGAVIMALARPQQPVALVRLDMMDNQGHPFLQRPPSVMLVLPPDILPGNVLRVGSDGASVECERVLSWRPLRYILVRISFTNGAISQVPSSLAMTHSWSMLTALNRSSDRRILVLSQVTSVRQDLAVQGIANVPAREALVLTDTGTGASQRLLLPPGGQIVQTFWTAHTANAQLHIIPADVLASFLTLPRHLIRSSARNASPLQQDEWMLEGHAGLLFDAPTLPMMCYRTCSQGPNGAPHVSAAILHGIAFVETNWHQFNTSNYRANTEPAGTPVESWDGGWGEFQQTWGMPPQCATRDNCRSDTFKIQYDQSYNIGVGIQSLISAWNATAGVASTSDPNDPYKANHWLFAVWAYNGSYGNNPNDVPSSSYGQWYPGAPFRAIYEEYVWYFAAHPQNRSSGWTDSYLPGLGSNLLPPQSDFARTSDSFVACVTCTIPDWTSGSYDRDWVGIGAPDEQTASYFQATFEQFGGEDAVGLPRDNGGSAAVHRWASGWTQDFGGGAYLPGALMLADGATTVYWIFGGVWTRYTSIDHGALGCHGYPTSVLSPYPDPGSGPNTYLRQTFQRGYIVWNETTKMVVMDVCGKY